MSAINHSCLFNAASYQQECLRKSEGEQSVNGRLRRPCLPWTIFLCLMSQFTNRGVLVSQWASEEDISAMDHLYIFKVTCMPQPCRSNLDGEQQLMGVLDAHVCHRQSLYV